jgi:hypothetical protein
MLRDFRRFAFVVVDLPDGTMILIDAGTFWVVGIGATLWVIGTIVGREWDDSPQPERDNSKNRAAKERTVGFI